MRLLYFSLVQVFSGWRDAWEEEEEERWCETLMKLWVICIRMRKRNERIEVSVDFRACSLSVGETQHFQRSDTNCTSGNSWRSAGSSAGRLTIFIPSTEILKCWWISLYCSIQFTVKWHDKMQHFNPQSYVRPPLLWGCGLCRSWSLYDGWGSRRILSDCEGHRHQNLKKIFFFTSEFDCSSNISMTENPPNAK